jgi:diguanylate cyclase (GGDEF)-like protein/PAS domain S-box-containing protein
MRARRSSFRFLIAVTAGLNCTAALAIGLTIWWLRSDAIREASTNTSNLAILLAEQSTHAVQSIDLVLSEIKAQLESRAAATANDFNHLLRGGDTYQLLMERLSHLSQAERISLVDKNGRQVNTTFQFPSSEIDLSDRDYFQHFKSNDDKGVYISQVLADRRTGTKIVVFSKRINGASNEFLGVILIGVRFTYFEHIYQSITSMRDQSFLLSHRDGTVIVRYPNSNTHAGEKLPATSPWHRLVSQGGGHYRTPGYFDGEARLVAVHPLRDYPLVVNAAVSETAALATWRIEAITLGIGTLLVMLCSAFLLKSVNKQFRRLANSEATLAAKAYDLERANAKTDAALNNMSQGLVMLDSSGRLVVCNQRFLQLYGLSAEIVRPGCTFRDILNHRAAIGSMCADKIEQYIADVHAAVGKRTIFSKITSLPDGRIISIVDHPMVDGGWVATHEDVTEVKHREESFRMLFESNPVPMWVSDRENLYFLAVNEAAVTHYGYSREQFMSMRVPDLRPAEDWERFADFLHILADGKSSETITQHLRADGTTIDVCVYSRPLTYAGQNARLAAIYDVTERKRAEDELRRTQDFINMTIENVPLPIIVKDGHDLRFTLVNRAGEEWFGISRDKLIGKRACDLLSKEEADAMNALDNEALQSNRPLFTNAYSLHTPHNEARLVTSTKVAIRNNDGHPLHLLTVVDDVTERKHAEQRIVHMAHYDALTDLPNRASFNETLDATLNRAATTGEQFAVLSVDLDRFKEANDTYGHLVGDALLREVARRMQAAAGEAFLARVGGDEFILIVADGAQPVAATTLAERLLAVFVDDFEVEGNRLKLGMSMGAAIYPTDGADAKTLMTNADAALYRAKAETRGTALFFEPEMGARLRERHALQEDLRSAIDHGELLLHYQPQVKMSGETIGFEALARWQCPKHGMVPPGTFIPIAEESSLIIPVGEWVLREACREAASWPQPLTIAVNISPIQFRQGDLPKLVHSILLETGLAAGRLELEITESVMINNFSRAVSILNQLKSLGVRIAMDDFGTGYSSLSYLQSFCCDKIKIDRIFVCDLEHNYHSRSIVRAVIGLGRSLGLPILAEGVETEAQHAFLVQEGCEEVQGYLTGRPLPIADYTKLVGRQAVAQQYYAVAG